MIVNAKNKTLQHNLKIIELTDKEVKLLLLLADNKIHRISEIRKYLKYITNFQARLVVKGLREKLMDRLHMYVIRKVNKEHKILGVDLYRIIYTIGITY